MKAIIKQIFNYIFDLLSFESIFNDNVWIVVKENGKYTPKQISKSKIKKEQYYSQDYSSAFKFAKTKNYYFT